MIRLLLPTLIILRSGSAAFPAKGDCLDRETVELSTLDDVITFSAAATCRQYQKIFVFNPDPNATKGRVLSVYKWSGRWNMNLQIMEITLHPDGTLYRSVTRQGNVWGDKMYFAPTTGILINFTRDGGSDYAYDHTFTGKIAETPLHHHCPLPFIDLQPYVPVILEETIVMYRCDVMIRAPDGFEVRIDRMKDPRSIHTTHITMLDDRYNLLDSFSDFPVEETMTGSGKIVLGVTKITDQSHQIEIQLSAVKLNCTCGPAEFVFNSSDTIAIFETPEYPKKHCKKVPCQTSFLLPTELRQNYKIQVPRFEFSGSSVIEIENGPNGIDTKNKRMTRLFAFDSPMVTLKYTPDKAGETFSLRLNLVERLEGCECPHQTDLSTKLIVEIPAHCSNIDCLYLMPVFDDNAAMVHFSRGSPNDVVLGRYQTNDHESYQFYTSDSKVSFGDKERHLFRVHKEDKSSLPMVFNVTYSSSGVHISHAERCGCFNKTVLLEANKPLDLSSPGWPAHYCDNLVCVITYVAPGHHHLEVKLDSVSLEPDNDQLMFYDGTNITEKQLKVLSGEDLPTVEIVSSSTVMTTVFISNGAVAFDGFNGTISAMMDKTWADHLKHHISAWWWLLAIFSIVAIAGVVQYVRKGGLRSPRNVNLMDF